MIARTVMAMERLVDMPQARKHTMVLSKPTKMMGFRPILSEALPHGTAVILCETENMAPVKPAHFATSFSSTPKLLIISGRYGKTEVNARGSANLAAAGIMVSHGRDKRHDSSLSLGKWGRRHVYR